LFCYEFLGGPQFEMLLDVATNPSIVQQHQWEDERNVNLPYLPFQSTPGTSSKPYHSVSYGRQNGYHSHNKTEPTVRT